MVKPPVQTPPNSFLKRLSKNALIAIQKTFNQSLETGIYPRTWNTANISPIPKPGKPHTKASHFRPIAVSSCLGRVMEKILADRLQLYCITHRIFDNNQCGFQTNRSTSDLLTILINDLRAALDNFEPSHLITIDFSKAYDTVWHSGLLFKLARLYHIEGNILRWLHSFMSGRHARTTNNGSFSDWKHRKIGVPQGSSLSPILFILYTNDYSPLHPKSINIGTFADDTLLWSKPYNNNAERTIKNMQEELNAFAD